LWIQRAAFIDGYFRLVAVHGRGRREDEPLNTGLDERLEKSKGRPHIVGKEDLWILHRLCRFNATSEVNARVKVAQGSDEFGVTAIAFYEARLGGNVLLTAGNETVEGHHLMTLGEEKLRRR
jgi:hypothetical protein